ncbi:MAG: ASCH domain-containing protein [Solirubrobacterales bacterium]|nr:ASCH domain-containing protein [Solirubrobacterales bacterium]
MKVLNFYSQVFADQLRNGRKSGTIRLGDKSHKYERNDLVLVTIGFKHSPRERVFQAVIDEVEVKRLKELSPHELQHDNPECRRVEDLMTFLEQIYDRPVTLEDTVTVVRFSQIIERASDFEDRLRGLGGARN